MIFDFLKITEILVDICYFLFNNNVNDDSDKERVKTLLDEFEKRIDSLEEQLKQHTKGR